MTSFTRYNIRFFALLVPAAVLYFGVDLQYSLNRIDGYSDISRGGHEVVFFGDSSVYTVGACDTGRNGISDWFGLMSGKQVYTVANPGYSANLYKSFLHRLGESRNLPDLVVIPINLRNFSANWFSDPTAARSVERAAMELVADPVNIDWWYEYLRARFSGEIRREAAHWKAEPVIYGGMSLGTRQEIDDTLRRGLGNKKSFECWSDERFPYAKELKLRYQYHYMNVIGPDHALFDSISSLAAGLKRIGVPVIFYLTPINIEAAGHYIGGHATEHIRTNSAVVAAWFARHGLALTDLSGLLPDEHFVDKTCACEHYDDTGRKLIAERLVAAADLSHPTNSSTLADRARRTEASRDD